MAPWQWDRRRKQRARQLAGDSVRRIIFLTKKIRALWWKLSDLRQRQWRLRQRSSFKTLRLKEAFVLQKIYHFEYAADYERQVRMTRSSRSALRVAQAEVTYWKTRSENGEAMLLCILSGERAYWQTRSEDGERLLLRILSEDRP